MVPFVCLLLIALVCAVKAVRAVHLLHAALWLAGVSVAVTIMLYLIGAYTMAVIELSLSVGLITILLVFAISMVGADSPDIPVSKWINWPLLAAMLFLVIGLTVPLLSPQADTTEASFSVTFWQRREADVVTQIALIFAGVLGVLGLLTESDRKRPRRRQFKEPGQRDSTQPVSIPDDESELEKV
jgi:NADH:ubiquinone oxidoreductase subunit 6 (subunit J)